MGKVRGKPNLTPTKEGFYEQEPAAFVISPGFVVRLCISGRARLGKGRSSGSGKYSNKWRGDSADFGEFAVGRFSGWRCLSIYRYHSQYNRPRAHRHYRCDVE